MLNELKELWRFRELLITMVQRDLKIRYKNSVLGFFWSLLNPILTVTVMSFVFSNFVGFKIPNYTAYLLAAYLPFMFFQNCLMDSAQTVLSSMGLIKKIYFPREILPLAAVISNFINFAMTMGVFFGYMFIVYVFFPGPNGVRIWPFQATAFLLPVLMLISAALATGFSLIVSALNTFYEDVKYILGVVLYLLFFLCPIVYFVELVGNSQLSRESDGKWYQAYMLNPLAQLSVSYRKLLLAPIDVPTGSDSKGKTMLLPSYDFDWRYLLAAAVTSVIVLYLGYGLFNRLKWKFVERP